MAQKDETIAFAEQMAQNEDNFMKQQKQYLNSELGKQAQERQMLRKLDIDK